MNSIAVNILVQASWWPKSSFFLSKFPEVECQGHGRSISAIIDIGKPFYKVSCFKYEKQANQICGIKSQNSGEIVNWGNSGCWCHSVSWSDAHHRAMFIFWKVTHLWCVYFLCACYTLIRSLFQELDTESVLGHSELDEALPKKKKKSFECNTLHWKTKQNKQKFISKA